jgi:hypothetical protein
VYIGTLVDSVHKVVDTLRSKHGELTLAMLYNSGGLNSTSNWNLIVSGPWADEMGKFDATHLVAQALHDGLDSEHQIAISRVTILRTDDPFSRDMNFLYPVPPGSKGVPVALVTAGDVSEGGGFVLCSRTPETLIAETPPQTAR